MVVRASKQAMSPVPLVRLVLDTPVFFSMFWNACKLVFPQVAGQMAVAAPAGLVLFLLANVQLGGISLLSHLSGALDPFARLFGMDGVILLAFILGFPANEIVLPIIVMAYLMEGSLGDLGSLTALRELLIQNGWTVTTAVSVMLFSLMHWPCSTTCLTIKKESGSWKWTALSMAVPAIAGFSLCFLWNMLASLFLS